MTHDTNYVFIQPPPSPSLPALNNRTPTKSVIKLHIYVYLLVNLKRQCWSQNRLNCSFLFMLTLHLFYAFGYSRHCSGAYSCTCMELYKSTTRLLQLAGGCLKKCSFFIFLSPQQSTETLVCGPPTPYILYPPPC